MNCRMENRFSILFGRSVEDIASSQPGLVNARDQMGRTPLHMAVRLVTYEALRERIVTSTVWLFQVMQFLDMTVLSTGGARFARSGRGVASPPCRSHHSGPSPYL